MLPETDGGQNCARIHHSQRRWCRMLHPPQHLLPPPSTNISARIEKRGIKIKIMHPKFQLNARLYKHVRNRNLNWLVPIHQFRCKIRVRAMASLSLCLNPPFLFYISFRRRALLFCSCVWWVWTGARNATLELQQLKSFTLSFFPFELIIMLENILWPICFYLRNILFYPMLYYHHHESFYLNTFKF